MTEYLYTDIARRIETQIESGQLDEGQKLPSERKMSEQYGVSRNVIREALKILTEKGLVEIRSGKGGYIASRSSDGASAFENAIYKSKSSLLEILEARKAIELAIIPIVVEKATPSDISDLKGIFDQMELHCESQTNFAEEDKRFHLTLAGCTKNKTLSILVETFYNIIDKNLFVISQMDPNRSVQAQREHRVMIEAIERRDEAAVTLSMISHMNCIRNQIIQLGEKAKSLSV